MVFGSSASVCLPLEFTLEWTWVLLSSFCLSLLLAYSFASWFSAFLGEFYTVFAVVLLFCCNFASFPALIALVTACSAAFWALLVLTFMIWFVGTIRFPPRSEFSSWFGSTLLLTVWFSSWVWLSSRFTCWSIADGWLLLSSSLSSRSSAVSICNDDGSVYIGEVTPVCPLEAVDYWMSFPLLY